MLACNQFILLLLLQELLEVVLARAVLAAKDLGVSSWEGGREGGVLVVLGCVPDGCLAPPTPAMPPSPAAAAETDAPAPSERPPDFIRLVPCAH